MTKIKIFIITLCIFYPFYLFAQEDLSSYKYQDEWIEILPSTEIYIGPQGIGVPGAARSFVHELQSKVIGYIREEAVSMSLKELVETYVSHGAASFMSYVGLGKKTGELTADWVSSVEKDMGRSGIMQALSKVTGYNYRDEGRPGGMRILKIPGFEKMTLEQRSEVAGALLQMYKQAVEDYNSNYGYVGQGLYSGKLQQWNNMVDLWKNRPEVSRLKMKINDYAKPVPSYWSHDNQSQSMRDAKIMTEIVSGKNRSLIVGEGPEVDLIYDNMVRNLGEKNVKQLQTPLSKEQLQYEAKRYRADVILGVIGHEWSDRLFSGASYEGAEERVKEARKRSLEIDKARHPGAYGWPGKFGQPGAPTVLSNDIGGVMLQGVAKVSNATDTGLPLTGGMFSLIFQNGNAEIDIEKLRKFVTALWAVYFSEEGPGISIDPIAPGVDKHLVRYIGKVINSDLGRVMRETDYVMKKWAVGTEKPDVEGFKSVDDLTAQHGLRYLGASRRFWFVPEDMRFKKMSDALLFDSGKMTLKTEYVFLNKGARAEPADETFAKFFTDHYNEIAHKYPIYGELFEYAKLVSLARYLKERGVPMLWFLLVNKDMVITEDSPGTVDALAKKSDYCEYIKIEGGVDLAANPSSASYVMDQEAAQAIQRAIKLYGPNLSRGSSVVPSESITFEAGDEDLTLMPSQTLTLSRGTASGDKYQTDIAFHNGKEPGLELVRYYEPEYNGLVSFGKSWHLLIPYQVKPCGEEKINFLNAVIPKRMVIKNLLTGREANLTFSTDRYSIAGYVPEHLESSNVVGLFLLSDASYRLVDKIGNEFQFNQEGHLTDMILSEKYHVKFKYEYAEATRKDFNSSPYRIEPSGSEYEEIPNANIKLPKHLKIVDHNKGSEEIFVFNKNNRFNIMGYIPVDGEDSSYTILAFMTDGSFILADKEGKEISFSPSGKFDGIKTRVVKKISQGNYEVNFDYEFYKGQARIKQASAVRKDQTNLLCATKYEYASDGRLCKVLTPNGQEIEINYSKGKVMLASSEKN